MLKNMTVRATLIAIAWSISLSANAMADTPKKVDIAAGDLRPALLQLSKVFGVELFYQPGQLKDFHTDGVRGTYTPQAAVQILLKGTPLELHTDPSGAMLIAAPGASTAAQASPVADVDGLQEKEGKKDSSQDFLVAQATPGQTSGPSTVEKPDEQSSEKKKREQQLQEVIVTGSRIPTAAGQQTLPVRSYTREDIENSGQGTTGEFLNTLPDVSTITTSQISNAYVGVQPAQLHGLPAGTTLTLLNGRRLESGGLGFFDIGNIPASALERIEILPVGASAIYGADALGGAINFILRKGFSGFEINANLDYAPSVNNPGLNLAWGKTWERASISFLASYDHTGELARTQRGPSSNQLPLYVTDDQAAAIGSTDACAPGNVYSIDGSNLPGLNSSHAAIPTGISGRPTIGQFAATAGKTNWCNGFQYSDITPRSDRVSALLSGQYRVSDQLELFTEILVANNDVKQQGGMEISSSAAFDGTVSAANPYNPFGVDVNVSYTDPTKPITLSQSTSFVRPMVGARGTLFSDWYYEVTASWARDSLDFSHLVAETQLISSALASTDLASALNPFTTGPSGSPQLLASFANPTVDYSDNRLIDRTLGADFLVRGPLLHLPAGQLKVALGAQYSQENQDTINTGVYATPETLLRRNSYALFAEGRAPIVTNSTGLEQLSLTGAARYDHSDDYGGKATWQGGVQWRISRRLSLSGGYSQSYEAPQLSQISGPQSSFGIATFVVDPFRGNEVATYNSNVVVGPNRSLKPETGSSTTVTLAYQPEERSGLKASLTWYQLNIAEYIGSPAFQTLVDNPNLYPGAVTRAPPTAQDQSLGFLGQITQIQSSDYNYGDVRLGGFDADLRYVLPTPIGELTPSIAIANIYRWQSALTPGSPAIDGVSMATINGIGWAPRWKGTATLAFKRGVFSSSVSGRYIGSYLDYQDFVVNNNHLGNTWVVDANARYELGGLFGENSRLNRAFISASVVNLFNRVPPFSYNFAWYDYQQYDIRGRYVRLSLGARF